MFLTIRGIYTQLFENNHQKLKLLEEWQFSITVIFLWWRGNIFICCVWLKHGQLLCIYTSSRWRLSIHHAVHTIITLNHHITHLALIYILLVMKKTGHGILKKGVSTVMITEGINELNIYSNDISPTQLKTVLKLQISQLPPFKVLHHGVSQTTI